MNSLTPRQIALVRDSFAQIGDNAPGFGRMIYDRVMDLAPDTRPMFADLRGPRGELLHAALADVVAALDRLDPAWPAIDALGRRHREYGVVERHYLVFGAALGWALGRVLGEAFTPPVRLAWQEAYGLLSTRMIAAARR